MSDDCGCGCGGDGGCGGGTGSGPCAGPSSCGCCAGVQALTPAVIDNRPGLSQLAYRVGTHASFLATMQAALSGAAEPALQALLTRAPDDPSIAFLDCWATVADVLTFYTERIANEAYLRTATELKSVLELARLTGCRLRPGLAASAYLAYTLQVNPAKVTSVLIAQGSQAMSVPGPGQQPQAFETSADLYAQQTWNTLPVRTTTPAIVTAQQLESSTMVSLQGASLAISAGNRVVLSGGGAPLPMSVKTVSADATAAVTTLSLLPDSSAVGSASDAAASAPAVARPEVKNGGQLLNLAGLIGPLQVPPSVPPSDSAHLARTVASVFGAGSDVAPQLLAGLSPRLGPGLYQAWGRTTSPPPDNALPDLAVQRVKAGVFGATAPRQPVPNSSGVVVGTKEWPLSGSVTARIDVAADLANPQTVPPTITVSVNDGRQGSTSFAANSPPPGAVVLLSDPGGVSLTVPSPEFQAQAPEATDGSFYLTFDFTGTYAQTITISGDYGLASPQVAVGDGPTYSPTPGQTVQNSSQTEATAVSLSATGAAPARLSVTDELLDSPPDPAVLDLDAEYDQVVPGSWAVIERADTGAVTTAQVLTVQTISRSAYNISGKVTRLILDQPWLTEADVLLGVARETAVYVQSDPQTLARVADPKPVCGKSFDLDGIYGGLTSGRWLIIAGERSDLPGVSTGEVVMVAGTTQGAARAGDAVHTTVQLSTCLAYSYVRSTVTIWGNVVAATQGATQQGVLGSGSASQAGQSFPLGRSPLTYLPAPTAAGAASTLVTSVNGVAWAEVGSLAAAGPTDHVYMTQTDETGKTTVLFGDGVNGARLPTGAANVTAACRVGLGSGGDVAANQISQPQTRPQGVQGVTNPLPASGGADPDTVASGRANAPLAVMALDRVVSVQDYQDFARAWAGIGKASSVLLSDGLSQFVHLTICGTTDQMLGTSSALATSLVASLAANGDPHLPVRVAAGQIDLIVLAASVHLVAGYQWSDVSAAVRTALLSAYGYDCRALGQAVVLSDVVATIQAVAGVDYAIVTGLTVIALSDPASTVSELASLGSTLSAPPSPWIAVPMAGPAAVPATPPWVINPAQVAILTPDVPDSIVLTQIAP